MSYQLIKSISDSIVIAPVKTTSVNLGDLNSIGLWQFDCKIKMMLLSTATYSITNSKIFSIEEVEFPKEVPAIPNSMANRILEMACVLNYIKIISHKGRRAQALLPFILLKSNPVFFTISLHIC